MSAPIHLVPPPRPFRLPYQRSSWEAPQRVSLKRSNTWPAPELHTMAWAAAAFEPLPEYPDGPSVLPAFVPPPPPLSAISLRVPAQLPTLAAPATALVRRATPPPPLAAPDVLTRAADLTAPVAPAAPAALRPPTAPPAMLPRTAPVAPAFAPPPIGAAQALPAPAIAQPLVIAPDLSPHPAPVAGEVASAEVADLAPTAVPKPRLIGWKDVVITLAVAAATAASTLAALTIF